jgi:hypothetical protein
MEKTGFRCPVDFDPDKDLDRIGADYLTDSHRTAVTDSLPIPAIFRHRVLEEREKWMIATMGPFWGAIGLPPKMGSRVWQIQEDLFSFSVDDRWGQVNALLNEYYARRNTVSHNKVVTVGRIAELLNKRSHAN